MSFEESLVWHASPTLASIKIANLYSFRFQSSRECLETILRFNRLTNEKGIYIELLKNSGDLYLIFVYRKSFLQKAVGGGKNRDFLVECGYPCDGNLQDYLHILKQRINLEKNFPHEIGVFLGYPLEDVKAFISAGGSRPVLCGDWKVYTDAEKAKNLFCKYRHCKETYIKVYKAGRRFSDMLVRT